MTNLLEAYSTISPNGKNEDCSRFTVQDASSPFVLSDIVNVDNEYTFSFWLRSDATGRVVVEGKAFQSSSEWQKFATTFTASSKDIAISFDIVGTYYVYHPQLEIGNKATDWSPAPEDVDDAITKTGDELRDEINEQSTEILASSEAITLRALESYVKNADYETYKESTEAELKVQSDKIDMRFDTVSESIDKTNETLNSEINKRSKRIEFSDDGIRIIGGNNEELSIRIDDKIISFERGERQFGWWDGEDFHTGNIMVEVHERAQFGNFAYVPRNDGSLSFLLVRNHSDFYTVMIGDTLAMYGIYPTMEGTTMILEGITNTVDGSTLILGG